MFQKVLVANRGEIAVRIIRTLKDMGITSVAAFSDADRDALFVQEADEAYRLGPSPAAESYLNIEAILEVARLSGAEAVMPGYGFLSENAAFAQAVQEAGLVFVGPSPEAIRLMGDKVRARQAVSALGVPVVPGTPGPVTSLQEAHVFGEQAGYPVAVKAAGGGGGRGIRVVQRPEEMAEALAAAQREAAAYFKNPEVYLERYFPEPRHIEIQVLGDRHGHLVHLGERDCSVQRRHQKLIEETPSPVVDRELRARMGETALLAARAAEYYSAGTVEFLLSGDGAFYFLEMNTRIQVEHGITERVSGVDLIREMLLVAAGETITVPHSILDLNGHAIEVRINAENPVQGFRPTPGPITAYLQPGGIGIRVDSGVYQGYVIPEFYDSLIAKLIAWGPDREQSRRRMLRALDEYRIEGPSTTIPFACAVLSHPIFVNGQVGTTFVGQHLEELEAMTAQYERPHPTSEPAGIERTPERLFDVEVNRKRFQVRVAEVVAGRAAKTRRRSAPRQSAASNVLASPMHGTVVSIVKGPGEEVAPGETLFVIEAMKMENEVAAQRSGTIRAITVQVGETVDSGQELAVIE